MVTVQKGCCAWISRSNGMGWIDVSWPMNRLETALTSEAIRVPVVIVA